MHGEGTVRQTDGRTDRRLQFPVWRESIPRKRRRRSGILSIALHFGVEASVGFLFISFSLPLSPLSNKRERHHFDRKRSRTDGRKGTIIRNNLPELPRRGSTSIPISDSPSLDDDANNRLVEDFPPRFIVFLPARSLQLGLGL